MQNTPKGRRLERVSAEKAETATQAQVRLLERRVKVLGASSFQGKKAATELAEIPSVQPYLKQRS